MALASRPATGNGISVRQFCPLFIVPLPDCSVRTDLVHLLVMIKGRVKMFWERQEIVGVAARMEGSPKSWRPFSNSSRSVVPYQHRSFCSLRNPAIGGKCVP